MTNPKQTYQKTLTTFILEKQLKKVEASIRGKRQRRIMGRKKIQISRITDERNRQVRDINVCYSTQLVIDN